MASSLSLVVITFNEEKNIARCLDSIHELADEIIVVDSFSKDKTESIARSYPKVKFSQRAFEGHVEQKNHALGLAQSDWVLSLDADEALDKEGLFALRNFLKDRDSQEKSFSKMFRRQTYFFGKWIRFSGWYHYRLRLVKRGHGLWDGENPHDYLLYKKENENFLKKSKTLPGKILHYSNEDLADQVSTINKFSTIVAQTRFQRGQKSNWYKLLIKPWVKFFEIYFWKLGFLDGFAGLVIATGSTYSAFLKQYKLLELENGGS